MALKERPSEEPIRQPQPQPQPLPQPMPPQLTRRQLYAIVAAILVFGGMISGALIYSSYQGWIAPSVQVSLPEIEHTPVARGVVGEAVTLKAKVTGGTDGIKNVTLHYEWSERVEAETVVSSIEHPWKRALMLLVAAGGDEYAYTIPGEEVAGDIDYFIVATDKAGHSTSTPIYTVEVADFALEAPTDPIHVYIGSTAKANVTVKSLGGFSSKVVLTLSDTPYGVEASITPSSLTPSKDGAASAELTVSARMAPGTFRGVFELKITGRSGTAEHHRKVKIVVPNYELSVSPSSTTIKKGETAVYRVKVSPSFDFQREITFKLEGLPGEYAAWRISLSGNKVAIGAETEFLLEISTDAKVEAGTYPLILSAEGGGIKTESRITLTIK
ncbi:MAG: hypothetical protein QXR65_08270 [Candidatus Bathyarchaeia archaeon]